jgi:hypothetical protein
MPQFFIAVHRAHGFDPAELGDPAIAQDIDAVNDALVAAGVRTFVGGLQPPIRAIALKRDQAGELSESNGLYLSSSDFVDGFWVLSVESIEEAIEWGRKAARACRASVEVRPFY